MTKHTANCRRKYKPDFYALLISNSREIKILSVLKSVVYSYCNSPVIKSLEFRFLASNYRTNMFREIEKIEDPKHSQVSSIL